MNFCSVGYVFFIGILVPIYYIWPGCVGRKRILLIASLIFYSIFSLKALCFVLFSSVITYLGAKIVEEKSRCKIKKQSVFVIIAINLLILVLLKYVDFWGNVPVLKPFAIFEKKLLEEYSIVLPLGISFYTLALIGYLLDVYGRKIEAEHDFLDFLLFVTFFPHILQGPIARYKQLMARFAKNRVFNWEKFTYGLQLMLWGYIKKLVIADRAAIVVNSIYNNFYAGGGATLFVASILYTVQIYADFSGCVDIARGTSQLFGIELAENFRQPYLAASINDFWKRWHISLSSWFKDYIYIPLGGNRKGICRRWLNVMVVFLVSGLWHGAGWNFVIWGFLHGAYQVIGYFLEPMYEKIFAWLHLSGFSKKLIRLFVTFNLVNVAWIFFRAVNVRQAFSIIKNIVVHPTAGILFREVLEQYGISNQSWICLWISVVVLIMADVLHEKGYSVREWLSKQFIGIRWGIYIVGIMSVVIFGIYGVGYDASDFIYMKF